MAPTCFGSVLIGLLCLTTVLAWGMYVLARGQLLASLRERAARAEAEQEFRVAQARQAERTRIAGEMHDVLAHRISLLSVHAGALELRPGPPPETIARASKVIRDSAHQVLEDLREVIGVLRVDRPDRPPERPQPGLGDLAALAGESRRAGAEVTLDLAVAEPAAAPPAIARAAYRIVQEGLTNARKHAPSIRSPFRYAGSRRRPVHRKTNPVPPDGAPADILGDIPGAGTGLAGLSERAAVAGGRLTHGRTADGFHLRAWLPW